MSTSKLAGAKVLLSYAERHRTPVAYDSPGRFTGRIITFESLEQRLVGIDVQRNFGRKWSAYGRLDYDIEQERVRRGEAELRIAASNRLTLSGEFIHRAPLIGANSLFTVFEQNTMQHYGLRGSYRLGQDWFVSGVFGFQQYEGDESLQIGLFLRGKYGSFGYNLQDGYAGQNNGLTATLNYPLRPNLGVIASTGVARYTLFDDDFVDAETSLTGSVGFNYRPSREVSFDVLGQGVRNRFSSHDLRLFVKANYWFFKR